MKNYIVQEDEFGKTISYKVGTLVTSFPADDRNGEYREYLRYTEWVEAGNNPEDFWDRSDDLNETIVSEDSEPSEPKEEEELPIEQETKIEAGDN